MSRQINILTKQTKKMNNIPQQGFYFDGKNGRHDYFYDGKRMTGCTTILNVIAKPFLIQWAANMAVDYVIEKCKNAPDEMTMRLHIAEWLIEARTAHRRKKEKAGDWGTEMHLWVENCINSIIEGKEPLELPKDEKQIECAKNFSKWITDNKVKFIASERIIYSKNLFLGGIVDIICEIGGETWLADIKTSSGIYKEAWIQMAGYAIMLKEMGFDRPIKGFIVLNLRKNGVFEEKRSINNEDFEEMFKACLTIYRISEKIEKTI